MTTVRRSGMVSTRDNPMRGTIGDSTRRPIVGVNAMTGRHTAQDTSAVSSKMPATPMAAGAGTVTIEIAEAGAAEAMAGTGGMQRGSMAIRMDSTMARAIVARGTAIAPRRTAITNTPIVATTQAMATKITINKLTVRHMRTDINKATAAVAAGAGTNSTNKLKKPCGKSHGFFFCVRAPD